MISPPLRKALIEIAIEWVVLAVLAVVVLTHPAGKTDPVSPDSKFTIAQRN